MRWKSLSEEVDAEMKRRHIQHREAGVTLLEVLITLVVLSIGLLGLAGLQTVSLQLNQYAFTRSQASNLAYDITERMRANWPAATAYAIDLDEATPDADPDDLVVNDLHEWRTALAASLPNGTGAVEFSGDLVTVTIRWLDTGDEELEVSRGDDVIFEFRTEL